MKIQIAMPPRLHVDVRRKSVADGRGPAGELSGLTTEQPDYIEWMASPSANPTSVHIATYGIA
jgi:hypothetical protein